MLSHYSQPRFLLPVMIMIALLAAATGFFVSKKQAEQQAQAQSNITGLFWPNPRAIGEFQATAHTGNAFGLSELRDKWTFIFFGYTHCPDICPITLSQLAAVYPELRQQTENLQVLFVSVDPERDSIDDIKTYVNFYHPEFIGLGGSQEQVDSLTRQLGVAYFLNNEKDQENYLVDHSASLYLVDPDIRLIGKLSPPHVPETIKQQFMKIKEFVNAQN